jgi:hypothetical protein
MANRADRPLLRRLLEVPAWKERYLSNLRTLTAALDDAAIAPRLAEWQRLLEPLVKNDVHALYGPDAFAAAFAVDAQGAPAPNSLRAIIQHRRQMLLADAAMQAQRAFTLGLWDTALNRLLINDVVTIQNNPYSAGMPGPSPGASVPRTVVSPSIEPVPMSVALVLIRRPLKNWWVPPSRLATTHGGSSCRPAAVRAARIARPPALPSSGDRVPIRIETCVSLRFGSETRATKPSFASAIMR